MAANDKKPLEVSPVRDGVIPVDEWKPKDEDFLIGYAGKALIIPFDTLIDKVQTDYLNTFYVQFKDSYAKKFPEITHYLNYFLKYYDPDRELILNYLHVKFIIDSRSTNLSRKSFIDLLYRRFITRTMYDKVMTFVEDNYRIDLAQNKEEGKEYSESREFTNRHAKILMLISMFIKMLIPIVMHYIFVNKGKSETKNLIKYYKPLFDRTKEIENVNLYAKLFHSIQIEVGINEKNNPVIWGKYAVNGVDGVAYAEELLDKNLIVDNVFKYIFNKSVIAFNSVIVKTQLEYRCIKNFGMNLKEIPVETDSDGLSYLDKLEMDMAKIDENNILLSKINIKDTIKRIKKRLHIKISKKEREYYVEKTKVNHIGKALVFYYYSKTFGGFSDLNQIDLNKYMDLMILMKRSMKHNGFVWLPQIISANIEGKMANRLNHNSKLLEKFRNSPVYQNFMEEKYSSLKNLGKEDPVINLLNTIMNTQFSFIDYDDQENEGRIMKMDYEGLSQELQDFISYI